MFKRIVGCLIIAMVLSSSSFADTLKFRQPSASGANYYTWNSISATSQALVTGNAYIPTSGSLTTFTLPTSPGIGDHYIILGRGAGGWTMAQNASQTVYIGLRSTTTGTGGSLSSNNNRDAIEILCVAANEFEIVNVLGNITVV